MAMLWNGYRLAQTKTGTKTHSFSRTENKTWCGIKKGKAKRDDWALQPDCKTCLNMFRWQGTEY